MTDLMSIAVVWLALGAWSSATPTVISAVEPAADNESMVLLKVEEPDSEQEKSDGGILIREILRQAYLIAARDELGVITRDLALREPFPESVSRRFPPLAIHTTAITGKSVSLSVKRSDGQNQLDLLTESIEQPESDEIDYLTLITAAERLSRGTMVESLRKAGFAGSANRRSDTAVPASVEQRIGELNFVSQYSAAKELHALLRDAGESPAIVGALVRAYTHLGTLTQIHWSPAHKVFKARALLYAERLVASAPDSSWSYWHRAYARALIGFHAAALQDIDRARELAARGEPKSARIANTPAPAWSEILAPYCRYDFDELKQLSQNGRNPDALPTFLTFIAAESAYFSRLALDLSQSLVRTNPDCFLVWDTVVRIGELGHGHWATAGALPALHETLPRRFATLHQLPEAAGPLIAQLTTESAAKIQPQIVDVLVDATRSGRDTTELSWSVLGRMIDDVTFLHVLRRLQFLSSNLGVTSKEYVNETWPLVVSHPYSGYIRSYTVSRRDARWWDTLTPISLVDADFPMHSIIYDTMNTTSKTVLGKKAWELMYRHADGYARDLQWCINYIEADSRSKTPFAKSLLAVSPYSPPAMASLIKWDWPNVREQASDWEKRFKGQPAVQWELGQRYIKLKQFGDAERCLRQYVALSPRRNGFESLADVYKAQGDTEHWLATLNEFLKYPDEGLSHAQVRVKIADYYMDQRDYAKALPYAESAAETWAEWAMRCAARCNEGTGDFDRSEYWWRNAAERYGGTSTLNWYFWCRRTGQGEVDDAFNLANQYVNRAESRPTDSELEKIGVFYLLCDRPQQARDAFQRTFSRTSNPYTGLHVALLADAAGDKAARDTALRVIVEKGESFKVNEKPLVAEIALARFLRDSLAKGEKSTLDFDRLAESINGLQPSAVAIANVRYVAGRFFELHGDPKQGRGLMERCANSPSTAYCHMLARVLLRDGKQIPVDQQPVTVRGLMSKADRAARSGDWEKGTAFLERALSLEPRNRELLLTLAQFTLASASRNSVEPVAARTETATLKSAEFIHTLRQQYADLTEQERAVASRILYAEAQALARAKHPEAALKSLRDAVDTGLDDFGDFDRQVEFAAVRELPEYKLFRTEAPARILARQREFVRAALAANQPFPFGFSLPDIEGQTLSLSDYKGKVVIVDVWGTWCPPCRMEVPHLVELFKKYHDAGLEVIGINYEGGEEAANKEQIRDFVRENQVPYPCLLGDEATQNQIADFRGFPTTIFIDRSGAVRLKEVGYRPLSQLEAIVRALLEEPSANDGSN